MNPTNEIHITTENTDAVPSKASFINTEIHHLSLFFEILSTNQFIPSTKLIFHDDPIRKIDILMQMLESFSEKKRRSDHNLIWISV